MKDLTASIDYPVTARPTPRLSVEDEASLMNRGRGRQLLALGAGALLLIITGSVLLQRISRGDGYSNATAGVTRIEREQFAAFFTCAVPDVRASELSGSRLQSELAGLGGRFGKSYAKRLASCMPHMQALDERVRALPVPRDVKAQHQGLVAAASALSSATADYSSYLANPARDYEQSVAVPMIEKISAKWTGYQAAQAKLAAALDAGR